MEPAIHNLWWCLCRRNSIKRNERRVRRRYLGGLHALDNAVDALVSILMRWSVLLVLLQVRTAAHCLAKDWPAAADRSGISHDGKEDLSEQEERREDWKMKRWIYDRTRGCRRNRRSRVVDVFGGAAALRPQGSVLKRITGIISIWSYATLHNPSAMHHVPEYHVSRREAETSCQISYHAPY